jgi:hypothetical protein
MRSRKFRRIVLFALLGLAGLCLVLAGMSALSNQFLPKGPELLDQLTDLDKARLAEARHLRTSLGDRVWPGFAQMEIPIVIWNQEYAFLFGIPNPIAEWERVPDDLFEGQAYFRKSDNDPQNFAVPIGTEWAASMATKTETDAFLIRTFRDFLPPVIEQIFPYRFLIQPSEVQIAAVAHESFHVLQTRLAPGRLEAAEKAHRLGERYWTADVEMGADWETEIDLLAQALDASSSSDAASLSAQFLAQRDLRRQRNNLPAVLVDYERQLEWEEGLAKYVEMEIWRQASLARDYRPLPELEADGDFKEYRSFQQRWRQEISQMKRQAGQEGETRFYLTGMAQATLLDRLLPGWKELALAEGVFLEDLLREAVSAQVNP